MILSPNRRLLFAVNAGSNSIACFRVNANAPGPPLRAARTVASGGVFPVSLTFRSGDGGAGVLYVLNAGKNGNITGFRVKTSCEMTRIQGGRSSALAPLVDGPPFPDPAPNEVLTTPAQVGFTPNGRQLVVTFKGGPDPNDPPGLPGGGVVVFAVNAAGKLTGSPAVTNFESGARAAGEGFYGPQDAQRGRGGFYGAIMADGRTLLMTDDGDGETVGSVLGPDLDPGLLPRDRRGRAGILPRVAEDSLEQYPDRRN